MAREDLNSLLGTLFPFAQQMLENHGEFYPFGATMTVAGEIGQTAVPTQVIREDVRPKSPT